MLKVLIKHLVYEKCIQVFFDTVYKNFVSVKYDFDVGDLVEFKTTYRTGTLGPAEHRIKVYRDNFGGKEPTLVGFKAKIT